MTNQWTAALAGQTLGGYKLDRWLGEGAFGIVFEGTNEATGSRVAVKVLTPNNDLEATTDFQNEGVLLNQLNPCSGTLNFIDGGTGQIEVVAAGSITIPLDVRYHVLTLASGSLDELILDPASRARLEWVEKLRLWRGMIKSLMQMHSHGVAHRDLKCSNCLLLVSKNETTVRFGDLGRSKDMNVPPVRPVVEYVVGRGDLRFAPPEALFWQGGHAREDLLAADYYGLGSLLVELTTGQPITALAIGDFRMAFEEGRADFQLDRHRDLSALRLKYRNVIASVVAELPKSVQQDATAVLTSLCQPEPSERLAKAPFSRDRTSRDKLAWILRRADIMIHRLEIEIRDEHRRARKSA
ncbi:hypothetical protein LLS1_14480 [Leifsonia sp. LS1]|uniref:protein kinase domain-containing protein n=1 Tax=Leifsonia sp. LS1 TaxID=2828483 RepID=UPI001CFE541F|nr:protein kinase [Leifsonia sp. LS1]GIT79779.1 hypothetical protein LLS1_14480 [Leifsonia sp. LS1]